MVITELVWTDDNVDHLAEHDIVPREVHDVIWDDPWFEKRRGRQRYQVYGQTSGGRYLFIVLDREYDTVFYVVTARNMTVREKNYYRQKK